MQEKWYPTPEAAQLLGVSIVSLRRYRDSHERGFLVLGVHFRIGPSRNSMIFWNVEKIREVFQDRGLRTREVEKRAREIVKEKEQQLQEA